MNRQEIGSLKTFCAICDSLSYSTFGQQFSVTPCKAYRVQPNTLYSTRVKHFELEALRSFLLSFRKLLLQKETANLYKVMNVLSRYGSIADRKRLRHIKRELQDVGESTAGVHIGAGNPPRYIRPKHVVDTFFNGLLFHSDEDYAEDVNFYLRVGSMATLPFLHYIVFHYKQALRLCGAIKLRGLVWPYESYHY